MATKLWELIPKLDTKSWKSDYGIGSLVTFLVAAFLLGVSVLTGLILVAKLFMKPATAQTLTEWGLGFLAPAEEVLSFGEVITLGIVSLVGMIVALVSVYIFTNQALQAIVRFYAWLCAGFGLYVYLKVISNFYTRSFIFEDRFPKYILALVVINAAVYVLPLIYDRYNVRSFAIPIFIGNFLHLMAILGRNIFIGSGDLSFPFAFAIHNLSEYMFIVWDKVHGWNQKQILETKIVEKVVFEAPNGPDLYYFVGDIFLLILMVAIGISLVRNAPFWAGVKRQLDLAFRSND
ncbi:MAG: hypothetical protein Fur0022_35890 [Anaerolineales bacterium]